MFWFDIFMRILTGPDELRRRWAKDDIDRARIAADIRRKGSVVTITQYEEGREVTDEDRALRRSLSEWRPGTMQ